MSAKTKARSPFLRSQKIPMSYKDKLNPWCIIRPVSHVQMRTVRQAHRKLLDAFAAE